jgi:hypothetical protein
MGYWEKIDWQSIKRDVQKGWKEGVAVVKEGAIVAKKKAGKLGDEGQRRYEVFELKTKVHKRIYDLGGRVHKLLARTKSAQNPALDTQVKAIMTDIRKLEARIGKLSGASRKSVQPAKTAKPAQARKRA